MMVQVCLNVYIVLLYSSVQCAIPFVPVALHPIQEYIIVTNGTHYTCPANIAVHVPPIDCVILCVVCLVVGL